MHTHLLTYSACLHGTCQDMSSLPAKGHKAHALLFCIHFMFPCFCLSEIRKESRHFSTILLFLGLHLFPPLQNAHQHRLFFLGKTHRGKELRWHVSDSGQKAQVA